MASSVAASRAPEQILRQANDLWVSEVSSFRYADRSDSRPAYRESGFIDISCILDQLRHVTTSVPNHSGHGSRAIYTQYTSFTLISQRHHAATLPSTLPQRCCTRIYKIRSKELTTK